VLVLVKSLLRIGWPVNLLQLLAGVMSAGGVDSLQRCPLDESGAVSRDVLVRVAVADTIVSEALIFILLPLGGARTSWQWSSSYERSLDSACGDVQRARLHAVMFIYRLLLLDCGRLIRLIAC
jgi:hypothetical protein